MQKIKGQEMKLKKDKGFKTKLVTQVTKLLTFPIALLNKNNV